MSWSRPPTSIRCGSFLSSQSGISFSPNVTDITFPSPVRSYDPIMDDSQRTFFVTTVTWQRLPIFRVEARAQLLIDVLLAYRDQGKYLLHEFVVMPDHIHVMLTPAADISVERAVQFIKGGYSYRLRKEEKIQVWQPSFTNHRIRDAEDYERHGSYVRLNPVRAGLVRDAAGYPSSSAGSGFRMDAMPQGLKPDFSKSA
jgi:putative transposase